jgi:pre-mRNA-splicing factor ATP-dependent RNA helicase DHX38/PRP16
MKAKSEAVSEFAMSKSIREQREYLPVYSVRDELLAVSVDLVGLVGHATSGIIVLLFFYVMI